MNIIQNILNLKRRYLEQRYFKKEIANTLNAKEIEEFLRKSPEEQEKRMLTLKESIIHFVLILVDGNNPRDVADTVNSIVTQAVNLDCIIDSITGSLITITAGPFEEREGLQEGIEDFIVKLKELNLLTIRCVFGQTKGLIGNLGGKNRFYYTFTTEKYPEILRQLILLEPGTIVEFKMDESQNKSFELTPNSVASE